MKDRYNDDVCSKLKSSLCTLQPQRPPSGKKDEIERRVNMTKMEKDENERHWDFFKNNLEGDSWGCKRLYDHAYWG